ncbi:sterile alpha motif domain-containing 3-like isoform X2 [Labeo rohita]|uniref:Sterile alpha motif domain-containing 3-like isoform X2 n=1 Tax=Labeo rohita TaxID=84645 RepID=A0A498LEP5_LABRO|nr:sterile alpha motif domain-containing 3-like isoform X2 [Labeo rohita]
MPNVTLKCGEIQIDGGFEYRLLSDYLNQTNNPDCEQSWYLQSQYIREIMFRVRNESTMTPNSDHFWWLLAVFIIALLIMILICLMKRKRIIRPEETRIREEQEVENEAAVEGEVVQGKLQKAKVWIWAKRMRYPTTSEYVQVVKMLIAKYPFLKDLEGNGYAPSVLGEDPSSIEAHVNVLNSQYQKMQPDFRIVRDRMQQTFAWRQKEIADGMTVEDTVKKYPFLRTPTGAIGIMNSFVNDIFERIVGESSRLARYNKLHHHIERDPDRRASAAARNGANVRLPGSFDIPAFPSYLQTKLDNKEPCQKNPKDRHIMIRVLYEAVAQYTMYAIGIMNSFVNDIFERIAGESSHLAHYNKLHHHIERDPDRRASAAAR